MTKRLVSGLLLGLTPSLFSQGQLLEKDDHVVWIGNTFAERMQYFGEVETSLHARFPSHNLTVRNLAWPADTVSLQPRPPQFGDTHHYLGEVKADVILACFGFNETWEYGGEDGLPRFRKDLAAFLSELQKHHYNGESAPDIVLYSPLAVEDERVPDKDERNRLLALYRDAMAEVAATKNVPFVDLFTPSQALFQKDNPGGAWTINGIHLTPGGYRELLPHLLPHRLFPQEQDLSEEVRSNLQREVIAKNEVFFEWFRTVNSFYIHGERKHPFGVTNFPAERKKLRQMARLHDERIWQSARGEELPAKADYSNTEQIAAKIVSPRAVSELLDPAEERKTFRVQDDYEVELFASEQDFPDLKNPVCFLFDAKGRLWVATMPSYPHALPGEKPDDKILILEDTDNDGRADKQTVFADGLYLPLGFELGTEGVYVSQEPNLVYLHDRDGDDRADETTILFHGFGSEDSHHAIHNFVWGQDGALYMQESVFQHSQIETPHGPRRTADNGMFRYDPRTGELDVVSRRPPGGNPWGHAINKWKEHLYVGDYLNPAMVNQPHYPGFGAKALRVTEDTRFCGQEFISSRHFPEELQGKVFSNIYKNYHGVLLEDWKEEGSGFDHKNLGEVMEARNQSFIPVDLKFAPDGSLYVVDWYNPVLGHMQYSLRDERRDYDHGRIWRITAKGRDLVEPAKIAGQDAPALLALLKTYENRTRYRVRRELWKLSDETLQPALTAWVQALDPQREDFALHQMEALWLHQQRGWVNEELLQACLTSPVHQARSAATQVLARWWPDLSQAKELFLQQARDSHPKVRLEAVVAATWASPEIAVPVLEAIGDQPRDKHLEAAYQNAVQALEPVLADHPMMVEPARLAKMALTPTVQQALVRRAGLPAELRHKALTYQAEKTQAPLADTLLAIITEVDTRQSDSLPDWLQLLNHWTGDPLELPLPALDDALAQAQSAQTREALHAQRLQQTRQLLTEEAEAVRSVARIASPRVRSAFTQELLALAKDKDLAPTLRQAAIHSLGAAPGYQEEIFTLLAHELWPQEAYTAAAAQALLTRGADNWPTESPAKLLQARLQTLRETPVAHRGEPAFVLSNQLLQALARDDGQDALAAAAADLSLRLATISTVPDQLKFAEETVTVEAGVPLELRFHNIDGLQHNVVIGTPGSLEKIGNGVDTLLADPTAMSRDWIPDMEEVLFHTPMADGEETVVVRFRVPSEPGRYPYLCTVPGHWRVMKGYLVVK
ncbi:PVC-type heme-binding CxxCH protein [Roseibacillus ishigakijimensis]|uniref:Membrane-bound dehydrogenase domain-containing protein n=1 Tax=Roseibacillus ishigakijimensis TaxID=454146 RepID=A0A934VLH6_9BACT|nr:PVC-type heme-binding CxxCH protein [Roseibacillus ishigakijimensis]MBK1833252.1 hypothetical protein [Roseibacillus ishigakijimensis]